MKENVCMKCGRRQCRFGNYNREDCPYEVKLPQLYETESESEVQQEPVLPKFNPLIKHFHIKEQKLDVDLSKITRRLMAEVTDTTDAVIVDAIKNEAARQGVADLFLIDRELVKNLITGETQKRGQWRYLFRKPRHAPISCTLVCSVCEAYTERIVGAVFNYCPNCGAKMDREEGLKQ